MHYVPRPLDTSGIALSPSLLNLLEKLAENTHEVWSEKRIAQGWTHGPLRNDARKQHPGLVRYSELSEVEKEFDRAAVRETLKALIKLGYSITEPNGGVGGDQLK